MYVYDTSNDTYYVYDIYMLSFLNKKRKKNDNNFHGLVNFQ